MPDFVLGVLAGVGTVLMITGAWTVLELWLWTRSK